MKNKFVVYTALFGDYDNLIDPKEDYVGCDFICFIDQKNLKSDIWDIRIVEDIDLPLNMMNRRYKILPHLYLSEYEQSLYVDTNIAIIGNLLELAKKYLDKYDFAVPKHFSRDCIYKEAKECVILGKSKLQETKKQMQRYKIEKFPKHFGMGENNIIFRKHNKDKIIKIMNEWWNELSQETKRDQLSLAYILWKNRSTFNFIDETARGGNGYFEYENHKLEKTIPFLDKVQRKIKINFRKIFVWWNFEK
jgi:hypothetical protein